MKANIGINEDRMISTVTAISTILADEFILATKTKRASWIVEGPDFYSAQKFFQEQYIQLEANVNQIALRIRELGHYPPATLKNFLDLTHLTEDDRGRNDSSSYIKSLLADHESIILRLREHLLGAEKIAGDAGTEDILVKLIAVHENMVWMLRSHLA